MNTPTSQNTRVRNLSKKREQIKAADKPARRRRRSFKHHLPSNMTSEDSWQSGKEPHVKTSRMFIGMLALHLIAVGGLVAFHFLGHDPVDKMPANELVKSTPSAAPTANAGSPAKAATPSKPTIPSPTAPVAVQSRPTEPTMPSGFIEHIVNIDETWESIAAARGLNPEDLRNANPGSDFNVGRRLMIPPTPRLITAASDTLSKQIAQSRKEPVIVPEGSQGSPISRYAINADSLPPAVTQPTPRSGNTPAISPGRNVQPSARNVAQTKPATTGVPLKASAVSKAKPSAGSTHVVGKGDTIFNIAKRNGVSEKAIMKLNGISDAGKLRPGQKLKMPAGN